MVSEMRPIKCSQSLAICILVALTGCFGTNPASWPPAGQTTVKASHPTDQTFRRKNWRNAVRFEPSEKPRTFTLGPLEGAAALRMGILREGRKTGLMHVQVHVGDDLVQEAPVTHRTSWHEFLINLSGYDPRSECRVTFEINDTFYVGPLELVPAQSPKPNVLVVVLDTLRVDHCSLYGYTRKTTPHLDSFAKDSVVFENLFAASSWTRPSIGSLMTGTYPSRHGARDYTDVVRADVPRIAKLLNENGYETYAVARNANVHPYWGLGNEFFNYAFFGVGASDEEIMMAVRRTLPKLKGSTWFTYIHLLDPHGPYVPKTVQFGPYEGMVPLEYQQRFMDRMVSDDPRYATFASVGLGIGEHRYQKSVKEGGEETADPSPLADLVRESMDLYDSEIREADARFGEILEILKKTGQFENTMIVFLSDHGEEFYEHENWAHGKTVFEESLRVPLIVRLPGGEHAGRRVNSIVETVDIAPTILEFLNIKVPDAMQGRSLLSFMAGHEDMNHVGFASVFHGQPGTESSAAKWQNWKLIVDHRQATTAWFNLDDDPAEQNPLDTPPENGAAMLDRLEALRFRSASGLHLVFTSSIKEPESLFEKEHIDVFEGELTVPGMGDVTLQYPNAHYTLDRSGDTIEFRIEMKKGETILPAHRLTHAELIIETSIDGTVALNLRKNGEPLQSITVPLKAQQLSIAATGSQTAVREFLAPAVLAAASMPIDDKVYGWFIPETASISESEMDEGMRESLEAMGYL